MRAKQQRSWKDLEKISDRKVEILTASGRYGGLRRPSICSHFRSARKFQTVSISSGCKFSCSPAYHRFSCPNPTCHAVFLTHDALAQHLSSNNSCLPSNFWDPSTSGAAHPSFRPSSSDTLKTAAYHPYSGYTYGDGENTFQKMNNAPYKQERDINLFYPFQSQAEWSLAKFLAENLTQAQINRFLALPWVCFFWSARRNIFN